MNREKVIGIIDWSNLLRRLVKSKNCSNKVEASQMIYDVLKNNSRLIFNTLYVASSRRIGNEVNVEFNNIKRLKKLSKNSSLFVEKRGLISTNSNKAQGEQVVDTWLFAKGMNNIVDWIVSKKNYKLHFVIGTCDGNANNNNELNNGNISETSIYKFVKSALQLGIKVTLFYVSGCLSKRYNEINNNDFFLCPIK